MPCLVECRVQGGSVSMVFNDDMHREEKEGVKYHLRICVSRTTLTNVKHIIIKPLSPRELLK
jgi:hypothetical protein